MRAESFIFGKMRENCIVVWNETGEALIFDPGCTDAVENDILCSFIDANGLTPVAILITHPHFDHISGVAILESRYGIECWVNASDSTLLEANNEFANLYDFRTRNSSRMHFFSPDGNDLVFGSFSVSVIPISGHTEGSLAYYVKDANLLVAGDTLRKGSVGFLETGYSVVLERLRQYVVNLPEETRIIFGHGEESTIGEEMQNNKFFRRSITIPACGKQSE